MDDYLTKPFDEEELLVRIENLLKNLTARRKEMPAMAGSEAPTAPIISEPDRVWLEVYEAHV